MFRFLLTFSAPRGIKLFKILKKHILTSKAEYANIPPIKAKYANISLSPGSKVLIGHYFRYLTTIEGMCEY